ncbi:hypothetical protein FEM48_Zijuj04G0113200 [Ziziphus jujuba var. spinosa]|uniref:Uncharacterized protein n=1 Tax=Ziziphus jujuba var. spinosa TaxID=714518 RepID=A0A978VJK5_ZIZJJ|nr:hypothetical protein FEM48_Zijuj04G0113200 [Ziziphus jujuba var. spinosa]
MAIEFCSEKSADIRVSPRISFSYDFCQSDIVVPAVSEEEQQHPPRSNSNIEFDFCVRESFELESSSADELFSDGKILPTEIKKKITTTTTATASSGSPGQQVVLDQQQEQVVVIPQPPLPPPPPPPPPPQAQAPDDDDDDDNNNNKSLKKDNEGDDKQSSKSFWRFKRSSSCGNGYGRRSLCPLPLLSRSNSTGSADSTPISKRSSSLSSKDVRHNSQRNLRLSSSLSSSSSSSSYQKPPLLKKSGHHHHHHHGSYTNGVSINPVLNVPPANLFGLGSIFSNGKEKGKKK